MHAMLSFRGHLLVLLVVLLVPAHLPRLATARTWHVTVDGLGDAPTIQAGIDSASVGDSVLVGPGTYDGQVNFRGRDIVLKSDLGPSGTVLDGGELVDYTVRIEGLESRAAVLEGFSITGGRQGVSIRAAAPTIRGNVIHGNGDLDGAGIWITRGDVLGGPWAPLIADNVVSDNRSLGGVGGGIAVFRGMIPDIIGNTVEDNYTIGDGGGIYWLGHELGGTIQSNLILNNTAGDHGGGIYINSDVTTIDVSVDVLSNLVAGNVAEGREDPTDCGGGIRVGRFSGRIHHNTIVRNSGEGLRGGQGGALAVNRSGSPLIDHNIFAYSLAGGGVSCTLGATPVLMNNLTWANVGGEGVGECTDWWLADENVSEDPQFCDLDGGTFTVTDTSPALSHPGGTIGAYSAPGCKGTPVRRTTWGAIKSQYGR